MASCFDLDPMNSVCKRSNSKSTSFNDISESFTLSSSAQINSWADQNLMWQYACNMNYNLQMYEISSALSNFCSCEFFPSLMDVSSWGYNYCQCQQISDSNSFMFPGFEEIEYNSSNKEMEISDRLKGSKQSDCESMSKDNKRDMVNYSVLEGHQYEIKPNPKHGSCKNTRIYVCKYDNCNKEFSKTWNLVYHFRVHTKEKPFRCSQCPKSFTQNSNLKKHVVTHLLEGKNLSKIYECDKCFKKYSSIYYLRTHKSSCHQEAENVQE